MTGVLLPEGGGGSAISGSVLRGGQMTPSDCAKRSLVDAGGAASDR